MGADTQNNQGSQEIDLSYLSKKTVSFFDGLGYSLYKFCRFLWKNIIILAILIVVGAVAGYFLDKKYGERYKHEVIVVPNFNSTSYLYGKIKNSKFTEGPITKVEIEPIVDIYQFINEGYNNLEIAKYLSENNLQLTKYEEDSDVEKFYKYHLMTIYTNEEDPNAKIVKDFINELNRDEYFLALQKIEQKNLEREIEEYDSTIREVNKIFAKLGSPSEKTGDMNIEMYSELNDLINGKKSLLRDYGEMKANQLEQTKIVYDASILSNIEDGKFPRLILVPALFVVLFLFGALLKKLANKYKVREKRLSE